MNITPLLNNFYYGEITPKAHGLLGTAIYAGGCETLQNFIPMKTGGFRTRPGTRYVGGRSVANRLITFYDSDGVPYILAIQNTSIQPYSTSTHAAHGSPLTTALLTAELWEMQYAATSGDMYLVHRSHAPEKITAPSGTFALSNPAFTGDRTFAAADAYPGVITFASGRLFLGSTNDEPCVILASAIPTETTGAVNYLDFDFDDASSADAIYLLENDMQASRLAWLQRHRLIVSATDKSTWQSDGATPTPESFDMNLVAEQGAAEIQPVKLGNLIIYVATNGKSIRAMSYSTSEDYTGYADMEISTFADHLFLSGITELNVSKTPEPLLFVTCADGSLVIGSVSSASGNIVVGFSKQVLGGDGLVESCAVAEKSTGDEIWLLVNRDGTRTIEYMVMDDIGSTDLEDSFYVDCGLALTPASETVTGLSHLEGQEVQALGDGAVMPLKTVSSGQVVYDYVVYEINIGYGYTSIYRNLRVEYDANGTAQGKKKRVEKIGLRLYRSLGGFIGSSADALQAFKYSIYNDAVYGGVEELYTGDMEQVIVGILNTEGQFSIYRTGPRPFNVLAIFPRIAVMEV